MTDASLYRTNVGIMVLNKQGLVLACRRANLHQIETLRYDQQWQMPQGGVNSEEDMIQAGYRELEEETAIKKSDVEFVDFWDKLHFYNFDETGRLLYPEFLGQKQKWLVVRYLKDDLDNWLNNFCRLEHLGQNPNGGDHA